MNYDQIAWRYCEVAKDRRDALAARVIEGLRLSEHHGDVLNGLFGAQRIEASAVESDAVDAGDMCDRDEADIMSRARVLATRIAEAGDEPRRSCRRLRIAGGACASSETAEQVADAAHGRSVPRASAWALHAGGFGQQRAQGLQERRHLRRRADSYPDRVAQPGCVEISHQDSALAQTRHQRSEAWALHRRQDEIRLRRRHGEAHLAQRSLGCHAGTANSLDTAAHPGDVFERAHARRNRRPAEIVRILHLEKLLNYAGMSEAQAKPHAG